MAPEPGGILLARRGPALSYQEFWSQFVRQRFHRFPWIPFYLLGMILGPAVAVDREILCSRSKGNVLVED